MSEVMLDLETLGTSPGCAVLSLGAVEFDLDPDASQGGVLRSFKYNVSLQSCLDVGLTVEGATVEWWLQQSQAAQLGLLVPQPSPLPLVLGAWSEWFAGCQGGAKAARLWSHGASFDPPLLQACYRACGSGFKEPWNYKLVRDTRTLFDLTGVKLEPPAQGVAHDALDDCLAQVAAVRQAWKVFLEGRRHG